MDTGLVAEQFEISRRRGQQLAKAYRESGEIPELGTPGRRPYADYPADLEERVLDHDFEGYLSDNDINHTLCKVGRPQSNGKIERFFQTYEKHRWRFGTLDKFLTFYNEERPHMSLDWDKLETPADAFNRLLPSPAKDCSDLLATEVTVDG